MVRRPARRVAVRELRDRVRDGLRLLLLGVPQHDRGWATELSDGVGDAHACSEGRDADLCFEEVDVKLEKDVSRDFLLCEI